MSTRLSSGKFLGKYREIIIAVAFFLIFDLAVLVLNFFVSFEIDKDSVAINLAGRQRMLSQRMTKTVWQLDDTAIADDAARSRIGKELETTVNLFDSTLTAFRRGGTVSGGDGRTVDIAAVRTEASQQMVGEAQGLWDELHPQLDAVLGALKAGDTQSEAYAAARRSTSAANLKLLDLMNQLTSALENEARAKAGRLRLIQTAGITAATLNFLFILYKFLRRLNEYDRRVERAQQETSEILSTVKEGLFLVDPEFRIGEQMSASLPELLGCPVVPGMHLRDLLAHIVPQDVAAPSWDYVELLMGNRVKENLVLDLNPLSAVRLKTSDTRRERHVTLLFNRVIENAQVRHLLVTVLDVSRQLELEAALGDARSQAQAEVSSVFEMLRVDPPRLTQFLEATRERLRQINEVLRGTQQQGDYRARVNQILRQLHSIKGDAAILDLHLFENLAQRFEAQLIELTRQSAISGEDLLALPLPLDELFQRLSLIEEVLQRAPGPGASQASPAAHELLGVELRRLAERTAEACDKRVELELDLHELNALPAEKLRRLREIVIQLVRNAVVHGVETPQQRIASGKPASGKIEIVAQRGADRQLSLAVRDDGAGISATRIREALVHSGRLSDEQAQQLGERELVMKVFEAGFSTLTQADKEGGHGIGLDLVARQIRELGGRLSVSTRESANTQFTIKLPSH